MMKQRGMFGSLARQITPFVDDAETPPVRPVAPAPVTQAPAPAQAAGPRSFLGGLVKYQRPEGMSDAQRMAMIGATMRDVGAGLQGRDGGAIESMMAARETQRQQAEEQSRMERLRGLVPDNPLAQLLFALDPKAFGGALAEGLKPQTREGGKVYVDPMTGARESVARIDQFGDRYGFADPETLETGFGAPRDPTFAEQTGRMSAETSRQVGMGNLDVARGRLGLERERFNQGPATGGGGGLSDMSDEELLEMLRQ